MTKQTGFGVGLAVLIAAFVLMTSLPASGKKKSTVAAVKDRLFDHARHPSGATIKCARCHMADEQGAWKKSGKKEHARCFECHKYSASCSVLAKKEGKVCLTCHTTFQTKCTPAGYVRPTLGATTFSAKYSHRIHAQTRALSGAQCESCHGTFGVSSPSKGTLSAGHAKCSGCHARGVAPLIATGCEGCHIQGGPLVANTKQRSPYSVAMAFDHKRHARAKRVGTEGRDCLVCHSNIKDSASDSVIPMPTMAGCMTCHDGKKAFNAIGTTCTQCHVKGTGR